MIKLCLRNSLMLNMLTVIILIAGIVAAFNANREAFPSINFDLVNITTIYPGASAKSVELYVTNQLEEELEQVDGIEEISSTSLESRSQINIKLDPDLANDKKSNAINDIQRAIDRVRDLPKEIKDPPLVTEVTSGIMPVVEIGISGNLEYSKLHNIIEELADIIERLPDARKPALRGFLQREYHVEVDPQKLEAKHVSLRGIITTLNRENLNIPAGVLKAESGEFLVRTVGEVKNEKEIEELIIRTNTSGVHVYVGDVATVKRSFEDNDVRYRVKGQPGIGIIVKKSASGDIISLIDDVKVVVNDYLKKHNLEHLNVSYINDISIFVRNRLGVLVNNGIVGIILVLLSLLLFLSKGIALVAAIGMPVAFIGALLVMNLLGLTINLLTMFALVIVLGMLVDDAIIVAENIWRHYEEGKSPWDATIAGTQEVVYPVTATILTTIAAFSPLLMVSGIFGKFIEAMPKVVIVCLLISLIEAMFILPSHAYDVLRFIDKKKKTNAIKKRKRVIDYSN